MPPKLKSKGPAKKKVCVPGDIVPAVSGQSLLAIAVKEIKFKNLFSSFILMPFLYLQTLSSKQETGIIPQAPSTRIIECDVNQVLTVGNSSVVFAGAFRNKSVAVEMIKKVYVDQEVPANLLKISHLNVAKIIYSEEDAQFRYHFFVYKLT